MDCIARDSRLHRRADDDDSAERRTAGWSNAPLARQVGAVGGQLPVASHGVEHVVEQAPHHTGVSEIASWTWGWEVGPYQKWLNIAKASHA